MSIYSKALAAIDAFQMNKKLPPKFNKDNPESVELNEQLQALMGEIQDDIDDLESRMHDIERFELAWENVEAA